MYVYTYEAIIFVTLSRQINNFGLFQIDEHENVLFYRDKERMYLKVRNGIFSVILTYVAAERIRTYIYICTLLNETIDIWINLVI